MYSWNGIALDNRAAGWGFLKGSNPYLSGDRRSSSFATAGDGNQSAPSRREPGALSLKYHMAVTALEAFAALTDSVPSVLSFTGGDREATVELMSRTITPADTAVESVDVTLIVQLNEPFWRDEESTTSAATAITSSSQRIEVFESLSAPVRDAIVRVSGGITGVRVTDAGGSWFGYTTAIPSGSYLRFHSDTGRAYITTTDTWTGGTEVTGLISNGPGDYPLEITPTFTDPTDRVARLTVTSTARTGTPRVSVRGKRAYSV